MPTLLKVLDHAGSTVLQMLVFAALYVPLERIFPSRPQPVWRRGSLTDSLYWMLQMPVNKLYAFAMAGIVSALSLEWLAPRSTPGLVGYLPAWLQAICLAFATDFIQYWLHRLMHNYGPLWRVHAVHHSSRDLDWITAYRRHPFEIWLSGLAFLLLAHFVISPRAASLFLAFSTITSYLPHANLNWTYGPLRYVFVSPVYHRWHHTQTDEGGMKNFANLFSCIDLAFGTFYLPLDRAPGNFGVGDEMPESFLGQMAYPFWRAPAPVEHIKQH